MQPRLQGKRRTPSTSSSALPGRWMQRRRLSCRHVFGHGLQHGICGVGNGICGNRHGRQRGTCRSRPVQGDQRRDDRMDGCARRCSISFESCKMRCRATREKEVCHERTEDMVAQGRARPVLRSPLRLRSCWGVGSRWPVCGDGGHNLASAAARTGGSSAASHRRRRAASSRCGPWRLRGCLHGGCRHPDGCFEGRKR